MKVSICQSTCVLLSSLVSVAETIAIHICLCTFIGHCRAVACVVLYVWHEMIQVLLYSHHPVVTGPSSRHSKLCSWSSPNSWAGPRGSWCGQWEEEIACSRLERRKKSRWYFRWCCLVSGVLAGFWVCTRKYTSSCVPTRAHKWPMACVGNYRHVQDTGAYPQVSAIILLDSDVQSPVASSLRPQASRRNILGMSFSAWE